MNIKTFIAGSEKEWDERFPNWRMTIVVTRMTNSTLE